MIFSVFKWAGSHSRNACWPRHKAHHRAEARNRLAHQRPRLKAARLRRYVATRLRAGWPVRCDPAAYPYSSARRYFKDLADDLVDDYNIPALPLALQSLAQLSSGSMADALFAGSTAISASALST